MQTSFHGNDKGNAVLLAVSMILIFSIIFISLVPYISAVKQNARLYREKVLLDIQRLNREIIDRYDLN
jgi:hypothetical protein